MTTTDEILALAASAAPSDQADADLVRFSDAVSRGERADVVRVLRALRPQGGTPALPDSPAWRAWLMATAAIASTSDGPAANSAQTRGGAGTADSAGTPGSAEQRSTGRVGDLTVRFVVCAAATALGDDRLGRRRRRRASRREGRIQARRPDRSGRLVGPGRVGRDRRRPCRRIDAAPDTGPAPAHPGHLRHAGGGPAHCGNHRRWPPPGRQGGVQRGRGRPARPPRIHLVRPAPGRPPRAVRLVRPLAAQLVFTAKSENAKSRARCSSRRFPRHSPPGPGSSWRVSSSAP